MGAVATLSSSALSVEPGSTTDVELTVRNNGAVADQFSFEILGPTRRWVRVDPYQLSLFPGAVGTVRVIFELSRDSSVPAGALSFGVRVASAEDPDGSTVEQGTVEVAPFSDVALDLAPRALRGRWAARTHLAIDNRSNVPFKGEISATDPELALNFAFRPGLVDVAPGTLSFANVGVRPRRRFWRGLPATYPFQLVVTQPAAQAWGQGGPAEFFAADRGPIDGPPPAEDHVGDPSGRSARSPSSGVPATEAAPTPPAGTPAAGTQPAVESVHEPQIEVDGTYLQEPLLAAWLPRALLGLAALVGLGAILWFALVKPQIQAASRDEVSKQLRAAGITTTTSVPAGAIGVGSGSAGGTTIGPNGEFDASLLAAGNGTQTYTVPPGRTLSVTDLLVENPGGAIGIVTLARNNVVLMQWSMADFRDLDYHWITPTIFSSGQRLQMQVSGCSGTCTPALYFAGTLK